MPRMKRLQFVDGGFDGLGEVVQRAFADAVEAFIGVTLAKSQFFQGLPAMYVSTAVILTPSIKSR